MINREVRIDSDGNNYLKVKEVDGVQVWEPCKLVKVEEPELELNNIEI